MAPNNKLLKQSAEENRARLGDPTSLKAETSDAQPGESGRDLPHPTRAVPNSGESGRDLPHPTRAVPNSSESQSQGPTGSSTQQKSSKQHKTLKEAAAENVTMLGDPVSMKAEKSNTEGTPNNRGANSSDFQKDSTETPVKSKI